MKGVAEQFQLVVKIMYQASARVALNEYVHHLRTD